MVYSGKHWQEDIGEFNSYPSIHKSFPSQTLSMQWNIYSLHQSLRKYGTPHKKVYISYRSKYSYLRSSSYVPYFTLTPYVRTCWSTRSTRIPA